MSGMKYRLLAESVGDVVDRKNVQYGDAINDVEVFLKLLYPGGIPVERFRDVGLLVRMYDKMKRIASGNQGEENAWQDLCGYALLGLGGEGRWRE